MQLCHQQSGLRDRPIVSAGQDSSSSRSWILAVSTWELGKDMGRYLDTYLVCVHVS